MKAALKLHAVASLLLVLSFQTPLFFPFVMASSSGFNIDLFCQHGGVGKNVAAYPPFFVGQTIDLFAYVTYNQVPVQSVLVAFEVNNPQGFSLLTTTSQTNASGIATTSFTVTMNSYPFFPSTWEAIATTSPAQHSINDTMQFTVIQRLSVTISPTYKVIPFGSSILFTSLITGGMPPYRYQWYVNGTAVPGADSPTWTFTPSEPGTYYIYLVVTDSIGEIATSNIAQVHVTAVLVVGGQSMPANVSSFLELWLGVISLLVAMLMMKGIIVKKRRN